MIMSFPFDIVIGPVVIPIHALTELLAFYFGYKLFVHIKKDTQLQPLSPQAEWWIIVGMAAGAFIGSRLIAALENPGLFLDPPSWLYFIGGQTIAGGIAGGILGVEITKKILGVKRRTGDLFVFPLMLGIIIGRIGCFLTGIKDGTVGIASNLPWAFDQGDGIPRHPTSLYEIIFLLILWFFLKKIQQKNILKGGDLFSLFVLGYAAFRFFIEYIKPRQELFLSLSSIQIVVLILVLYYGQYLLRIYKK